MNIEFLLLSTAASIGLILIFFAVKLRRAGLMHWRSSGFWALASFALYFILSPAACALTGELRVYENSLFFVGGTGRGFWILLVAIAGICTFFITYLRTAGKTISLGLSSRKQVFSVPTILVLTIFTVIGAWSLLAFRAGLIEHSGDVVVEGSRFVGSVSGYATCAYLFLILPIFVLLISKETLVRWIGWVMTAGFIGLSAMHAFSRYTVISFLLGVSLMECLRKRRTWPKPLYILAVLFSVALLQARGHVSWDMHDTHELTYSAIDLWSQPTATLTGPDTAMLATWYVSSQLYDDYQGYDYGLGTLNYVLTGWIPYRYFPQKYFIIDWLNDLRGSYNSQSYESILYGAKSSLLGSYYSHGGIIAVILCMALSGFLCRRLDGMLSSGAPELVGALGIAFMSHLWMVWGSDDNWGITSLGLIAIPALPIWLILRRSGNTRMSKSRTSKSLSMHIPKEFV